MAATSFADTSIAGEHTVLVIAGVVGLAGIFLALLAVIADKQNWPYAWKLGFVALLFASAAGAGGLWKISGESGRWFLAVAIVLALLVWAGLWGWHRWAKHVLNPYRERRHKKREQDHRHRHQRDKKP
jgi:RsiW-degrading membrane proteinase PrsW (M82 family)